MQNSNMGNQEGNTKKPKILNARQQASQTQKYVARLTKVCNLGYEVEPVECVVMRLLSPENLMNQIPSNRLCSSLSSSQPLWTWPQKRMLCSQTQKCSVPRKEDSPYCEIWKRQDYG